MLGFTDGHGHSISATAGNMASTTDAMGNLTSFAYVLPQQTSATQRPVPYSLLSTITTATDTYAVNNLNQYATVDASTYGYDGNGNLTADGTWTYAYDPENRLLSAAKTGTAAAYAYDVLGRRASKTVNSTATYFLDDGTDEIAEYGADVSHNPVLQRRFVPGPSMNEPIAMVDVTSGTAVDTFFHTDHHGSVIAMSGAGAAHTEGPFRYDSYGNMLGTVTGEPYRYTGMRYDIETGNYYDRARYYSPLLGRFLQTDPVGYEAGLNLYLYGRNDPVNQTDPLGLYNCIRCSDVQLKRLNDAVNRAHTALHRMKPNSREEKRLQAVLGLLGGENDGNNVNIDFEYGGGAGGGETHTAGGTTTISFDSNFGTGYGGKSDPVSESAGLIAHEGSHALDQKNAGMPRTEQQEWDTEATAYDLQSLVEIVLGNFSSYGLYPGSGSSGWHPGENDSDRRKGVVEQSKLSVIEWCSAAGSTQTNNPACHGSGSFNQRTP